MGVMDVCMGKQSGCEWKRKEMGVGMGCVMGAVFFSDTHESHSG